MRYLSGTFFFMLPTRKIFMKWLSQDHFVNERNKTLKTLTLSQSKRADKREIRMTSRYTLKFHSFESK